ncbi:deoxyribodipyrimidine photo-lyase [Nocardioides sp. zg-1228]|uniref:cryptochrome/photolyase family protein n=1 Tax=Nocardioides sp. zg-1228 TaxID=2763008 RepID=UPI001642B561|nr:deoxyribodipyrimidine photo-lyase [Nocardioides sp. zg-1228]MBC2933707.1 deoxyribodipyrimidine photo-lyase [Nocardioides sp. zg-1228]QSF58490.1 deoxyribodipyrimidine photo-lyase [Nocardioides sp. zg-1228]
MPTSDRDARSSLVWFRRDLRVRDNPALLAALEEGTTTALFVVDPALWAGSGPARRAWLAANVLALAERIPLTIHHGDPREVVPRVAAGRRVHVAAETTPYGRRRDEAVGREVELVATGSPYAVGPGLVRNGSGGPYQVFSAFARAWREHGWPEPAPTPRSPAIEPGQSDPRALGLLEDAVAGAPFDLPPAGEDAAWRRWRAFRDAGLHDYDVARDRPHHDGTSRLSPYLHLGVLHPRSLLAEVAHTSTYATELAWREFYADVLWHAPGSAWADLRPALAGMRYDDPEDAVEAWRTGTTGYPVVDAGMRQLLHTGWMHNRVRMITASFLTKDLHVWWPVGARHFLDLLIDGDVASNNHGWQWVAGTGTDASPYFRVFNPVTQGLKFDPDGDYVRRWVPELAHLPGRVAHEPWRSDVGHEHDYPVRIVDHAEERREALERYQAARR